MQRIVHKNWRRIGGKDQAELSCIIVDILYGKLFQPTLLQHQSFDFDESGYWQFAEGVIVIRIGDMKPAPS
jgi:hypothetical protein